MEDCERVRSRAFEILTPSPQLNYIGIYGNSNPLNISEWIQLINITSANIVDQVMTNITVQFVLYYFLYCSQHELTWSAMECLLVCKSISCTRILVVFIAHRQLYLVSNLLTFLRVSTRRYFAVIADISITPIL